MHILIGVITLLGVAAVWYWRFKMAREAGGELLDVADDLRGSVRRLMYKRKRNKHPADSIDDGRLAASGIAVAVAAMDAPLSQAEIAALGKSAKSTFNISGQEADDIVAFGRWIADQCGTPSEAVRRLSKALNRTAGAEAGPDMIRMINDVATADGRELGEAETDAISTVRRTLGIA
ncbi:MAG: TerB family tellurite resistance protein [Pseudomonadota bacterium]